MSEARRPAADGAAPEGPAVRLRDVVKRYPSGVLALDGVNLEIERNEFVAITGPSGCGKSTLLHLVAALDGPTSGLVEVNGRDLAAIRDLSYFRRREVGLVFQLHNLLPRISVVANIEIVMYGTGRGTRARRARARELLAEVDLVGRGDRLPTQLSGGERQRVAIARALANEPALLLADEPTGNLDAESAHRIMDLFDRVRSRGVTILLVTHDEDLAGRADRTARIESGRIVARASSTVGTGWSTPPSAASRAAARPASSPGRSFRQDVSMGKEEETGSPATGRRFDGQVLTEIGEDECYSLLETQNLGRLAVVHEGRPEIFPVNYALDGRTVTIRTAPGAKLASGSFSHVAFEVEEIDPATREGWVVEVRGFAEEITEAADAWSARARGAGAEPWVAGAHDHYLAIHHGEVSGRRISSPPAP